MSREREPLVSDQGDGWVGIRGAPLPVTVKATREGVSLCVGDEHTELDADGAGALAGALCGALGWLPNFASDGLELVMKLRKGGA